MAIVTKDEAKGLENLILGEYRPSKIRTADRTLKNISHKKRRKDYEGC